MTKEIALRRHGDSNDDWRNMPLNEAMKTPEGLAYFEQRIAPSITAVMNNPALDQAIRNFERIQESILKAYEQFAMMEEQMNRAMEKMQRSIEMFTVIIPKRIIADLERFDEAIRRAESFTFPDVIDVTPIETEEVIQEVPTGKTVVDKLPRKADFLCARVSLWGDEGLLYFQAASGWSVESIGKQTVELILRLREKAQDADHEGLKAYEMNDISDAKEERVKSRVVLTRIRELRKICKKYGAPYIIIHEELTCRWRYNPDLLLAPDKFSRSLTKCSQDES